MHKKTWQIFNFTSDRFCVVRIISYLTNHWINSIVNRAGRPKDSDKIARAINKDILNNSYIVVSSAKQVRDYCAKKILIFFKYVMYRDIIITHMNELIWYEHLYSQK